MQHHSSRTWPGFKRMLAMLCLLLGTLSAAAQTYISDVCISSHKQRIQAVMQAQMQGWEVIDGDLNWDAGGDYIFLCVKRSNSVDDAITDMVIMNGSDYKYNSGRTVRVDGLTYHTATLIDPNPSSLAGDLNKDAGGSDLFLYVTHEKKSGQTPHFITNLKVRSESSSKSDEKFVREGNDNKGKGDCMDCNRHAGGRYVYIEMYKSAAPQLDDVEELKQAFHVYRGGGELYQIDVPLLFRLGEDGDNYLVGGGTFSGDPSCTVQFLPEGYNPDINVNWHDAFTVSTALRPDGLLYSEARPCEWRPIFGTLISAKTLEPITGITKEEQNHGNAEDLKYATAYWRAPEGFKPGRFRLIAQGCTVGQTDRRTLFTTVETEDVVMDAPTGMNLVNVMNPMMNVISSADASVVAPPGSQILQVQTANPVTRISLWDGTLKTIVNGSTITPDKDVTSFAFDLPHYEEEHSLAVLANGVERVMDSKGGTAIVESNYTLPVTLSPFHTITSCTVEQSDSIDADGTFGARTFVHWTVPNIRAQDAMPEDEFIVQRAYTSDFSDAVNIGSIPVGTLPGDFLTIDHSTNVGTFTIEEIDDGGWSNPLDVRRGAKVYYRVFRALVYARWGESSMSDFCKTDSLALDIYLAHIERVKVQRLEHFDTDKAVRVRLELPMGATHNRYWFDTARIVIERSSPAYEHYEGRDYAKKTIIISGDEVHYDKALDLYYAEVEDIQGAPYLHYFYSAVVEPRDTPHPMITNRAASSTQADADSCYSETLAPIRSFTASRGTVKGMVALEWETDEGLVDYYRLERRPYGSTSEADFRPLALKTPLTTAHLDRTASSAQVYEYRVTAGINLYGKAHERTALTYGWNPYYGTLRGTIRMSNGALLPGSATITVRSVKTGSDATPAAIRIPTVLDVQNDTIIVPAYNKVYERTVTTTDGTFLLDDIPYSGTTRYEVEVSASGSQFVRRGQEDAAPGRLFYVSLDNSLIDPELELICQSARTFSGRVLYTGSTIPVRDCRFLMNGTPVLNGDGSPITTDSKGNFSFDLPAVAMDLQVVKDGHTFLDGGYVIPRAEDVTDAEHANTFTPSANYPGLLLYDDTKVRLVGRLAGGDQQGCLPLGFGLGTNNLGDNLKMVLELEGDPTALIVFDNEHPDRTTRDALFTQHNYLADSQGHELSSHEVCPTSVTFEKKRIVISPDEKTGEFCLDLPPTKYKVTELSADGYPTLFNAGEGFQVLDLSNRVDLKTDTLGLHEGMNIADNHQTQYHATYKSVRHNPVTVTLTQYEMGQPRKYYGAKDLDIIDLSGNKVKVPIVSFAEKTDSVQYLFDYPLFVEGKNYDILVSAHEDYYYNGNTQLQPDVVPLEGGQLKVRNGLVGNESETLLALSKDGKATISFIAANPTFSDTGEDALRSIRVQVENNGYYYENEELRAFVTGSRFKGNDVITIDDDITLLDVIRDPYGSKSSAYREAGTKYHWEHTAYLDIRDNMKLKMKTGTQQEYFTGAFAGMGTGTMAGVTHGAESSSEWSITYPLASFKWKRTEEYDMTLNTRIETSSDPLDVGAMADIYIGMVNTMDVSRVETFGIINQTTYDLVRPGIEAGAIRVVSEGKDAEDKPFYLVVSDKIGVTRGKPRNFIYTQKYIVNVLMPSLDQRAAAQMLNCSKEEAQKIATETGETKYIWEEDANGDMVITSIEPVGKTPKTDVLSPQALWNSMMKWALVVAQNEQTKLEAMQTVKSSDKSYSIAAPSKIEHSEAAEWYNKSNTAVNVGNVDVLKGLRSWNGISIEGEKYFEKRPFDNKIGNNGHTEDVNAENEFMTWNTAVNVMGSKLVIEFQPVNPSVSYDNSYALLTTYSGGSGYTIETNDNSYFDINVHQVEPYSFDNYFDKDQMDWVAIKGVSDAAKIHEWVYTVKGGAERQPWYEPDSTLFYHQGTPLTTRTLRIDNPRIYIDNPVVSNVPSGEKAIFKVRLANETELPTRPEGLNPSKFALFLDDEFCPDGASITMDGQPIADGREFYLDPGQSITKTIVVERCGKTYDYENMRLGFMDAVMSMIDYATLSAHFLPSSTPVNVVMPADKWVLNTLSAVDEQGRYYLPVEVDGYDVNYENFDHIEVQYKKHTDGESKWVNLCSYFKDKDLYEKASGEKAMLGKINLRFYGDADPMEMQYDLRAVSFCRLGNGYVTKSSAVVTGTKDTRAPEVFGMPKPTNGILSFEDVISVPFSEPIAYNYLDETANFQVVGFTNDSETDYATALAFSSEGMPVDEAEQGDVVPVSKIKRNLSERDFTISAVVQLTSEDERATFMRINDRDIWTDTVVPDYTLDFCYRDGHLVVYINSVVFVSQSIYEGALADKGLSLYGKMTSVAMTYRQPENVPEGEPQVRFYMDGVEIPTESVSLMDSGMLRDFDGLVECDVSGHVAIGERDMSGRMANVRLWDKVVPVNELMGKMNKRLNGTEPGLLGYWPMDEMSGNVLYDKAHGADLHFRHQTWTLPEGQHALRLSGDAVRLANTVPFARQDYEDYTLGFWMQPQTLNGQMTDDGSVNVFQVGADDGADRFRLFFDKDEFKLQSGEKTFSICPQQAVADGAWHNIIVVANKSMNDCTAYIDGQATLTLPGSALCGMQETVALGGRGFFGNIDNVNFWHLALPQKSLSNIYNFEPSGREMGLAYFLPFEMDVRNSQNTWESRFSPYNMVVHRNNDGTESEKVLALDCDEETLSQMDNDRSYPPLRSMTGITNIPFSWSSDGNELQINLKQRDADINHQQVFVTLRGVEDLAGNTMKNPLMMSMYVDRSVLVWKENRLDVTLPYGTCADLTAEWSNKSGRALAYSIVSNEVWLEPSMTMGVAAPMAKEPVTIHVGDNLPPGTYTGDIYLVDENGLSSPLAISLAVVPTAPAWSVTNDVSHSLQMGIVAMVKVKTAAGSEYFDMDARDVVAAFDKTGHCVGLAPITVDNKRNSARVNMTIYGTPAMNTAKEEITFRLWRASTSEVYYLRPADGGAIVFEHDNLLGCPPDEPVTLVTYDQKIQEIALEKGWNWVSWNIKPGECNLGNLFLENDVFEPGDYVTFNTNSGVRAAVYSEFLGMGRWSNTQTFDADRITMNIYVSHPCVVTVAGSEYTDADRFVTLKGGVWNDLPYLLTVDQPISKALSDLASVNLKDGTIVKSRKEFAVIDRSTNTWVGSLQTMRPGVGYYIRYFNDDKRMAYTNTDVAVKAPRKSRTKAAANTAAQGVDLAQGGEHVANMPVIADVATAAEDWLEGDVIVALAGGEVVGTAPLTALADGRCRAFISINAEDGSEVRFAHVRGSEVLALSSKRSALVSDADSVVGTLDSPYLIEFDGDDDAEGIYDLGGIRYPDTKAMKGRHGVWIINGKKELKK